MRVIRCGMRRSWIALGVGLPLAVAGLYALSRRGAPAGDAGTPTIAKLFASGAAAPAPASLAGLDITNISMADNVATAPLPNKRTARLTLDTNLQNAALGVLESHHIPEAAVDSTLREIQERRLAMSKFAIQKMGVAKTFLTPEQQKRFFSAIIQARSPRPDRFDGPFDRGRPHRDKGGFDGPPPKPNW